MTGHKRTKERDSRSTLALAGIMAAAAGLLLIVGVPLVLWGGARLWIFGWILSAWGVSGVAMAVITAARSSRD